MSSSTEIEHKLYLFELPEDLLTYPSLRIDQAYLDLAAVKMGLTITKGRLQLVIRSKHRQGMIAFYIPADLQHEFLAVFPGSPSPFDEIMLPQNDAAYSSRIRKTTFEDGLTEMELTIKGPPKEALWGSDEATLPLTQPQSQLIETFLAQSFQGQSIAKQRYLVPTCVEELLWEVDVFKGHLCGLFTAECEVPSESVPCPPPPAHWRYAVITGHHAYSNATLSKALHAPSAPPAFMILDEMSVYSRHNQNNNNFD